MCIKQTISSLGGLALLAALAACGGVRGAGAPVVEAKRVQVPEPKPKPERERVSARTTLESRTTLEYHDESDRDRAFIENAERAIAQYNEFIARAGESREYAAAVKRSREQVQDLRDAIDFVRAGAQARSAR